MEAARQNKASNEEGSQTKRSSRSLGGKGEPVCPSKESENADENDITKSIYGKKATNTRCLANAANRLTKGEKGGARVRTGSISFH